MTNKSLEVNDGAGVFADRNLQARDRLDVAGDRRTRRPAGRLRTGTAGSGRHAGQIAEPGPRPAGRGSGAVARGGRRSGAAAALPRRWGPFEARSRQCLGAHGVRGSRTGPRRSARGAAHGRGRGQSDRDARRAVSPPGLRAHYRAHRKHDGRSGAPVGPRDPDPRAPAVLGPPYRRYVAALA